eukprot:CAMPEP_0113896426 /NCGR_PEP_ID=MMETSP0780_2-20120614/18013_1 /TAXON_ID=652834 /ORGANISM="Palpitomonas bilix" /LENGTH=392 /DNA_ID=CAMNT_0000887569 /DNA_START=95 /DNA_END=1273 /DNA_ORIENTATION=+ /assembly_acc=CAM_ASM_000599
MRSLYNAQLRLEDDNACAPTFVSVHQLSPSSYHRVGVSMSSAEYSYVEQISSSLPTFETVCQQEGLSLLAIAVRQENHTSVSLECQSGSLNVSSCTSSLSNSTRFTYTVQCTCPLSKVMAVGRRFLPTRTSSYVQRQVENPSSDMRGDQFGSRAVMSDDGNTIVIGSANDSDCDCHLSNARQFGTTYVYTRSASSEAFTLAQQLDNGRDEEGDQFGYNIAISGNALVIASATVQTNGSEGFISVYYRTSPSTSDFYRTDTLMGESGDRLGYNGVFLSSNGLVLAANNVDGAVYVWQRSSLSSHFADAPHTRPSSSWDTITYTLGASAMSYDGYSVVEGDSEYTRRFFGSYYFDDTATTTKVEDENHPVGRVLSFDANAPTCPSGFSSTSCLL